MSLTLRVGVVGLGLFGLVDSTSLTAIVVDVDGAGNGRARD